MALLYGLIIAHLAADFMQPAALVKWSKQHWAGLFIHTGIYSILSFAVLYGYPRGLSLTFILAATHFIIDKVKYYITPTFQSWALHIFLLDQILHISIIYLVYMTASQFLDGQQGLLLGYISDYYYLLPYITGYIAGTFGVSILVFEVKRTMACRSGGKYALVITFKDRLVGMAERAAGITVILVYPLFFLFPFAFSYSAYKTYKAGSNRYDLADLAVSALSALVIGVLLRFY